MSARSVTVAGVDLTHSFGCYAGQLGPFVAGIVLSSGDGGTWGWKLDERDPDESRGAARIRSCGAWDTPEEAAANMTRVVGLFASLPRGANA